MKKSLVFVLLILCCSLLFSQGSSEVDLFKDRSHFALITDKSYSPIVLKGSDIAVKEHYPYLQVDILRINNKFEAESMVLSAVGGNYDAILSYGESSSIVRNLAFEYSDIVFASISDTKSSSLSHNYTEFYYDYTPLSFLCGIGAYSLTDTRKIGLIAYSGDENADAFISGLKEMGGDISVEAYYIEENTDDETIKIICDILYRDGADIIYTLMNNKADIAIEKAREWGRYVIVGDGYYPLDSTVILSISKDMEKAVSLMIGRIKEGGNGGESIGLGLKDSVLDLSWFINGESFINFDDAMKTKIIDARSLLRRYRYEIKNGPQE